MANGRIMIVEDESLVAEDLEVCLTRSGYEVVGVADTYETARALADRTRPDLALLDIRLKGVRDGIDLAGELRARDIGFVYLTSHSDEGTLARAEVTEPLGYVLKPFGAREIFPVLKTALYRHASEVRQRNLDQWLSTTLRSIGDGVIVTDLDRRVTYMNPVAESLTMRGLRQASGAKFGDVLPVFAADTNEAVPCVAQKALERRTVVTFDREVVLRRADGSLLPVEDCAAPIVGADGTVSGVVVVFRDATDRLRAEAERRDADRRMQRAEKLESLGVLAGGLAHDLNNILTAILGNLWLCRQQAGDTAESALREIEHHAHAAADLCSRLLAGAGGAPTLPIAVDVAIGIDDVLQRERRLLPPGLVLERTDREEHMAVMADVVQFRQMLQNLVRNAIEAMVGRVGTVAVACARVRMPCAGVGAGARALPAGDYIRIVVSDQGPGIPDDVKARLFEPFFTTKFTGRGLGLASVHGIVRRHGGAIDVETIVGEGARFLVYWPATTWIGPGAAVPGAPPAEVVPVRVATGAVLVIDDDEGVRAVTVRLLQADGWKCHQADGAEQALETLARGVEVDGVILDVMMPGIGGLELRERLQRLRPGLPVLLVSGMMRPDGGAEPIAPGDVLVKPFRREELLDRVRAWRRRS